MKKKLLILCVFFAFTQTQAQDITEIWTNYDDIWNSSSTVNNPKLPDNSHELLAFRYNGTIYSTGVDDQKLTDNGVTFTPLIVRALPVGELPNPVGSPRFIGLGQLADGINNGVDNGITNPFEPSDGVSLSKAEVASFLTDGIQGLDLGTNVTNIVGGTDVKFELSSAGININFVNDGTPDILVSQSAQPDLSDNATPDELRFVKSDGVTVVGNPVTLNIANEPIVGNWTADFYEFSSKQTSGGFVNTNRPLRFFAIDIADFGIDSNNINDAVALIYTPNGNSDSSFIAFNEPTLGVASKLTVTSNDISNQNCDGSLPSSIIVRLEDQNGNPVEQAGIEITASLESGPGDLTGTLVQTTNASGEVTFDDLGFTVGASHVIRFDYASLDAGFTNEIGDGLNCSDTEWSGDISSDWYDTGNWVGGIIPDGNNKVLIPDGRPNYPILEADAGAGDLTMGNENSTTGSETSITLNGNLLALNGSITVPSYIQGGPNATIDASALGSNLFMSAPGTAEQLLPCGFFVTDVAKFTVERAGGVKLSTNCQMDIVETITLKDGNFNPNGNLTIKCYFDNEYQGRKRSTGQIVTIDGTIGEFDTNGTFTPGDVTVEQCFPGRRAYRFVTASTTGGTIHDHWQEGATAYDANPNPGYGTHITGLGEVANSNHSITDPSSSDQFQGLDWNPSGNASMYSFKHSSPQGWEVVKNTNVTLNAGDAYLMNIRGSRAVNLESNTSPTSNTRLRSTGKIIESDVIINRGIGKGDYAFIGNPYHASIDMNKVLAPNSGYTNFIYVFDPNLGGTADTNQDSNTLGGRGGYVTVNVDKRTKSVQSGITGIKTTEANSFLQPYQAVFVQASSTVTPGDIVFKRSYKRPDELQPQIFSTKPEPHVYVNLYDENSFNNLSSPDDGLVIYFSQESNNAVDDNDAMKFTNTYENLARIQDNKKISFENRALPENNEVLELFIDQYTTTNYKLEIGVDEFLGTDVYLYDNYTDTEVAVNNDDYYIYSFTVDESISESVATNRFEIRLKNVSLGTNDFEKAGITVYPNPVQDVVTFNLAQTNEIAKQLSVFDVTGKLIDTYTIDNQENYEVNMSKYARGLYIVKIETETAQFQSKLIKQ